MYKLFTPVSLRLFAGGLSLIALGMLLGNMIPVYMGLLPLVYLIIGLIFAPPKSLSVPVESKTLNLWVDEIIDVEREFSVEDGFGPVIVGEQIPNYFDIVEGSNIRLFWKGFGALKDQLFYKVRCTRRGIYYMEDLGWEIKNSLNITPSNIGSSQIDQIFVVRPMPLNVKRIRQQKTFSKMIMPSEAQIKMGIPTTDFKEIREYVFGDSYRHINWKASSRVALPNKPPMVNSFEMEGMKVAWFFINTSKGMALGTTIRNSFEYAVEAVLGLTQFYLSRNCRVGLCLYNDEKSRRTVYKPIKFSVDDFLFPDLGKRQLHLISRKMLEAEVAGGVSNLREAIIRCRGHVIGTNPLFVVVTTINKENYSSLLEGLNEIRKYTRVSRKSRPPILIIHIAGYSIVAQEEREKFASEIMELEERSILRNLNGLGAHTVHWDPTVNSFSDMLLSQVKRR